MKNILEVLKAHVDKVFGVITGGVTAVSSAVLTFYYGLEFSLQVLIAFMIIDYVWGVTLALVNKKQSSNVMFVGGLRKGMVLTVVYMSYKLSFVSGFDLYPFATGYYIGMEALSIWEHMEAMGVTIPRVITDAIKKLIDWANNGNVEEDE